MHTLFRRILLVFCNSDKSNLEPADMNIAAVIYPLALLGVCYSFPFAGANIPAQAAAYIVVVLQVWAARWAEPICLLSVLMWRVASALTSPDNRVQR